MSETVRKNVPGGIRKAEDMEFEIVDETYGYNQSEFSGYLYSGDETRECMIEIFLFGEMKYIIED